MGKIGVREILKTYLGGKKPKRNMGIPQFKEGEGRGIFREYTKIFHPENFWFLIYKAIVFPVLK